jgi:1-acyl-sn-glycerol-3-phosphate acyltransferase/SAM-dependent methyltransferase
VNPARDRGVIDIESLAPQLLTQIEARGGIEIEGAERLSGRGPLLIAATHPSAPLPLAGGLDIGEDVFVIAALFRRLTQRPLWLFTEPHCFPVPGLVPGSDQPVERLGWFPGTVDNAVALLRGGEAVCVWPEGRGSLPGYQLRPFLPACAEAAVQAGVPVIPMVLLGPHEAHLRVEREGHSVILNPGRPCRARYRLVVLPPRSPLEFAAGAGDHGGMARFCDSMRDEMQGCIEQSAASRPLVRLARRLHERYSDTQAGSSDAPVVPKEFLASEVDALPRECGLDREVFDPALRRTFFRLVVDLSHKAFRRSSRFRTYGLWDAGAASAQEAGEQLVDRLLACYPGCPGSILELQCGAGAGAERLAARLAPGSVFAVDRNPDQEHDWAALAGVATFARMEPTRLTCADGRFDCVMCLEGAHRVHTREAMLREALRVLKPGGYLLMSDLLHRPDAQRQLPAWLRPLAEANFLEGPEHYATLLERVGFDDARIEDATDASIRSYLEHYRAFVRDAARNGRIEPDAARAVIMREVLLLENVQHYVLVVARKPLPARPSGGTGATREAATPAAAKTARRRRAGGRAKKAPGRRSAAK